MRKSKLIILLFISLLFSIPFLTFFFIFKNGQNIGTIFEESLSSSTPGSFDNNYCGRWQEQYTTFHRKMENSPNKKYLILDAWKNGWGDRLTQIITGFYIALLSGRSFKIIGIELEDIYEKPNIDWSISEEEFEMLRKEKTYKELYYTDFNEKMWNEGFLYTNFTSNYEVS